jgi:hypothetical protein
LEEKLLHYFYIARKRAEEDYYEKVFDSFTGTFHDSGNACRMWKQGGVFRYDGG